MPGERVKNTSDLNWKRVDDNYDDFEEDINGDDGFFYGLEELDGVDVQKADGLLNFIVKDTSETDKAPTKAARDDQKTAVVKDKKSKKNVTKELAKNDVSKNSEITDAFPDFSVLQEIEEKKQEKQIAKLGNWPKLDGALKQALAKLNFLNPTKIQEESIPLILEGEDVIGKAATGSGKTLAFGLPILDAFINGGTSERPQGLVISPTRELAHQIRDHLNAVIKECDLENTVGVVALTGGLAIQKQLRLLGRQPVIVVATPGRLLEILENMSTAQKSQYQKIPTIVLDEADRLVQANSFQELDRILDILGRSQTRQTLVYSATFKPDLWAKLDNNKKRKRPDQDIRDLLEEKLNMRKNASFVDADPEQAVATKIVQGIIECPPMEKDLYLYYFLLLYPGKTIVFVNSIDSVKRLVPFLKELGIETFGVHSDMVQKQRLRSLERFKAAGNAVLVATDVAARGLDVPLVDHVAHYHLPRTADMYVHRSGRTARAGQAGVAVMICSPEEASGSLLNLKKLVKIHPHTLDVDYAVLERIRSRSSLAKKIADQVSRGTHEGKKSSWLDKAAEDLGIDLDEDEREKLEGKKKPTEGDIRGLRAQLSQLLAQNIAPSRKYLTDGVTNMAQEMLNNPNAIVPGRKSITALAALGGPKKGTQNTTDKSKSIAKSTPSAGTKRSDTPTQKDSQAQKDSDSTQKGRSKAKVRKTGVKSQTTGNKRRKALKPKGKTLALSNVTSGLEEP